MEKTMMLPAMYNVLSQEEIISSKGYLHICVLT